MDALGRSWFMFTLLLLIILMILFGFFYFTENEPLKLGFSGYSTPIEDCVPIIDNGDYNNKLNVLFLADNFDSNEDFIRDTQEYVNTFFTLPPYNQYKDRFNFFRIEGTHDLGCEYGDAVICDDKRAKEVSLKCPSDYTIIITKYNGVQNLFKYLRSAAYNGVVSLNNADNKLVFPHEFAHLAYKFADEYEYEGKLSWDAPNCDKDSACKKFGIIDSPGCFLGCTNFEHNRECETCIMRDYWKSDRYGTYNELFIDEFLKKMTSSNQEGDLNADLVVFSMVYDNGEILIENSETANGYSPKYLFSPGYRIETGGSDFYLGYPNLIFEDVSEGDKVSGGVIEKEFATFTVLLPSKKLGDRLNLINPEGELIQTYPLDSLFDTAHFTSTKSVDI